MTTFFYNKAFVKKYPLSQSAFIPHKVVVPLCQEYGVPCKPLVQKGDKVQEGQIIAVPEGDITGAKIHSPVPGVVEDIFIVENSDGKPESAIQISFGGSFSWTGKKSNSSDWENKPSQYLAEMIDDKGVVNTFDVSKPCSLNTQIENLSPNAKNLVIRLFDEDPVRLIDTYISSRYLEQVVQGADILAKAAGLSRKVFFFDSSDSQIKTQLMSLITSSEDCVCPVNTKKYPAGFKKELCICFNKAGKNRIEPVSEEDLFVDSSTLYEINKSIRQGIPSVEHLVQISGDCIPISCVLSVRLGTSLTDLVNQLGGFITRPNLIIMNGHITGNSVTRLDVSITKNIKSISFLSKRRTPEQLVYDCVSCGNCRQVCPRNLSPDLLFRYMDEQYPLPENYLKKSLECSECGLCNSVCPSRMPLQQVIELLKRECISKDKFMGGQK